MQYNVSLKLTPQEANDDKSIKAKAAQFFSIDANKISGYYIIKKSIDARSRHQIWFNLNIQLFYNEPFLERLITKLSLRDVSHSSKKVIIIGAGPAGLFAALQLIELGIKPIILERGKDVKSRRRDLATLNKEGIINTESNYCFGEGGAGTYSDGKLYTRSKKRGSIDRILNVFVEFGADENILFEAHPHIGTNKLPNIISNIRNAIIDQGGEIFFEHKVVDFILENNCIKVVKTANGNEFNANAIILATGHSARDIYELLHYKKIEIEAKPFALGVRVEHQQETIDNCQYKLTQIKGGGSLLSRPTYLPAASYSLVEQVNNRGVFSFCMCPGGIIAPAATNENELVVNGWSPSKRNNEYANSGMVVQVFKEDAIRELQQTSPKKYDVNSPLLLMHFQRMIEEKAFEMGGGHFVAPAQRLVDFCDNKNSSTLPKCSYHPGLNSVVLTAVLPSFIHSTLQNGFKAFGKRMKGFYTNDAVVVGVESRTSSPVRIPRNNDTLQHPKIKNLYPCAEGSGFAGGIMSAAIDGENVAKAIALTIR